MQRHEFPSIADLTIRSPSFCASVFVLTSLSTVLLLFTLFMPALSGRCSSVDCKRATEELQSLMDADVEPCSDFYHHVCNKWLAENTDGVDLAHATVSQGLVSVERLLQGENRDDAHSATFQLKAAFLPCLTFLTSDDVVEATLALAAHSNIDLLLSKSVQEALQMVVQLSLLRGVSTLFHVSVVRHDGDNTALYVSQAVPLSEKLKDATSSTSIAQFLEALLHAASQALPEAAEGDVTSIALRLIDFDKSVQAVEPEDVQVTIAAASDHLTKLAGGGDFVGLVNSLLPETWKLNVDSSVFCSGLHAIERALGSFRSHYKLGLLYIFVHVLVEIGQLYYVKQFIHKKPTSAKTCLEASRDVMSPRLWSAAFDTIATRGSAGAAKRVVDIFHSIRKLSSRLPLPGGTDEEEKRRALSALSSVQLLSYNVSSYTLFNDSISADFGTAYVPLKMLEASRRLAEPPYIEDVLRNRYALISGPTYIRLLNAVVFPPLLRRPPFVYSEEVPVEFDLATAGTALTRRVFQAGLPRSAVTWRTENVARLLHCAEHVPQLTGLLRELTPSQALDTLAWMRSVKVAHLVMTNHYEWLRNETMFKYDHGMVHRTFFRRFCLSACRGVGNNGSDADAMLHCLLPILTMPEFSSSFGCVFPEATNLQRCLAFGERLHV
ncbi:hypothetical protein HPB50_020630 [Hyalomma asiaticum]|uniref:Uncharacterized protein n=1 Tax=Hyalomma asiaticum TaxID=266040 RepID=A0ACB7S828_HYAAI|nr:hypothetical protein HPB50_020630 [Hyalomma asiaticum]